MQNYDFEEEKDHILKAQKSSSKFDVLWIGNLLEN